MFSIKTQSRIPIFEQLKKQILDTSAPESCMEMTSFPACACWHLLWASTRIR